MGGSYLNVNEDNTNGAETGLKHITDQNISYKTKLFDCDKHKITIVRRCFIAILQYFLKISS